MVVGADSTIVKKKPYVTLNPVMNPLIRFLPSLPAICLLFLPASSGAKELFGKMGLGYNAQFANTTQTNGVPGISLKYGLAPRDSLELIAGFYSGSGGTGVFAGKFMHTLIPENYANFYFLAGAGYVYASRTGIELLGGLGAEFFIPGVDSIGISFETGMSAESITSSSGSLVLKTFGVSFLNAGMHYYF
ncbi:hypothetical protein EB061_08320 [bacterium]|jgi:hypothetical protein|nr:hypothetical protein [bacterium]